MFYKVKVKDHIRVPPKAFASDPEAAVIKYIKEEYSGHVSKDFGFVINVLSVENIKEGVIIPGDGAAYYESFFELLTFKPELNEVLTGKIRDITDFGAFMHIGPVEGMIHVSQSMDDFVSFSKDKVLQGRKNGRTLKIGDQCKARIIAVSFKDLSNPKIGLTMRQEGLGKLEWLEKKTEAPAEAEKPAKKKEKEK
ncbi:DNA-directed RNA polymerase [Candidatus Woesearchaeota archaeon]|nr:DNA-directed RNA polymerase [Candidatus Woesearchaeota archaeon]